MLLCYSPLHLIQLSVLLLLCHPYIFIPLSRFAKPSLRVMLRIIDQKTMDKVFFYKWLLEQRKTCNQSIICVCAGPSACMHALPIRLSKHFSSDSPFNCNNADLFFAKMTLSFRLKYLQSCCFCTYSINIYLYQ